MKIHQYVPVAWHKDAFGSLVADAYQNETVLAKRLPAAVPWD